MNFEDIYKMKHDRNSEEQKQSKISKSRRERMNFDLTITNHELFLISKDTVHVFHVE